MYVEGYLLQHPQINMAEWYTTRIVKPIKIYETTLNTWVNLEKDLFKHPYVIYSYKYLKLNRIKHNTLLNVTVEKDRVKVSPTNDSIDTRATVVYLLIMESDESPLFANQGDVNKTWVTKFLLNSRVNNLEIQNCSISNNFTIKINDSRKFKCMIIPNSMTFIDNMDSYQFNLTKVANGSYKVSLQQSGSAPQSFGQQFNKPKFTKSFNKTSSITVLCEVMDIKLGQRDPNLYLDVYQNGTKVQRLTCRESDDMVNIAVGTGFMANFVTRVCPFEITGLDKDKSTTIEIFTLASNTRQCNRIEGLYFENLGNLVSTQDFSAKVVIVYE